MNKGLMVGLLFAAAAGIGYWRFSDFSEKTASGMGHKRLTMRYKGTVGGLFQKLTAESGVKYKVDPVLQNVPFEATFQNKTVTMIQKEAAARARVGYGLPDAQTREIPVMPKK